MEEYSGQPGTPGTDGTPAPPSPPTNEAQPLEGANAPPAPGSPPPDESRSWIPSEYQEAPQLKDVKDVGSLAKQFIDLQKHLGNSIRIPGQDASPEQRQEFIDKISNHAPDLVRRPDVTDDQAMSEFWRSAGVPGKAEAYGVTEGVEMDEGTLNSLKERANKYGMTQKAFEQSVADHITEQAEQAERVQVAQAEDVKALSQEWGGATEARLADVKKFAEVMGMPEGFREALDNGQVGSQWIKPIWNIITQIGGLKEGNEISFQPGGSIPDSPAELKIQLAEVVNQKDYFNKMSANHTALVDKAHDLRTRIREARN